MSGLAQQYLQSLDGRYPTPTEATELYRLRALDVAGVQQKPTIAPADLEQLDRLGRFQIASESFSKCDTKAQAALVSDTHHGVRAAAAIAAQEATAQR